jgi:hypothetical protein
MSAQKWTAKQMEALAEYHKTGLVDFRPCVLISIVQPLPDRWHIWLCPLVTHICPTELLGATTARSAVGRNLVTHNSLCYAISSIWDVVRAIVVRASHAQGPGNNPSYLAWIANGVGWLACWPAGIPPRDSTAGDSDSDDRGRSIDGNNGTSSGHGMHSWVKDLPLRCLS